MSLSTLVIAQFHDIAPPRTLAAICCLRRRSITGGHGSGASPMPSSSLSDR
ncbi:hypothetical protein [Pseudomonas sp. RP23018S]|uniref:hypothetical protein n=1 Tax=Pseudomonas sp. RP23018S TaxID=3096037 RepID=UPI003A0FC204